MTFAIATEIKRAARRALKMEETVALDEALENIGTMLMGADREWMIEQGYYDRRGRFTRKGFNEGLTLLS